ncbi:hypothetical protein ACFYZB_42985 [Streptomyces sp. NPDC001852]|uniref:hypothetical protein n=1 Tax=Streptomyces sp. NPDC001852 TaxID=3364619 RepID=UPI0036C2BCD2
MAGWILSFHDEQRAQIYGRNLCATVPTTRAALPTSPALFTLTADCPRLPPGNPVSLFNGLPEGISVTFER